jgi:NAD(P)-dependent dehydrogenase (short-subunit alcohol dehydrogenase family)
MGWLEGKVVLAVGGASGIGRAAVDAFVGEGARVAVFDISAEGLKRLAEDLGEAVVTVEGDATVLDDNRRAVEETVGALGGIDVLAVFPGIFDFGVSIVDIPADKLADAFDELFSVNVKTALLATKAALDELLKSEGSIVLTVSTSGFHPGSGGILYTPSKFAVRGLVTQLAYELAPKVRVNGVAPGGTVTGIRGPRALGQDTLTVREMLPSEDAAKKMIVAGTPLDWDPVPETHASAYVYLASKERAPAVTGAIISSDGGVDVRGVLKLAGFKD